MQTYENAKLGILGRKFSPEVASRVDKSKEPDLVLRLNNSWADLIQILKVMKEIGWPTRRSPNPLKLKKVVTLMKPKNNRRAS